MFIVYFYYSPYDGQSRSKLFLSIEKAIEYCVSVTESRIHPVDPFKEGDGWVIEEHVVDAVDEFIKCYNGNGILFNKSKSLW